MSDIFCILRKANLRNVYLRIVSHIVYMSSATKLHGVLLTFRFVKFYALVSRIIITALVLFTLSYRSSLLFK
jgi:hypothetical protein